MIEALIPTAALVRRELVRTLRQKKSLGLLVLLIALLALFVIAIWPEQGSSFYFIQRASMWIPHISIIALFFAAVTIIPGQAATCIRTERDKDTLDLLLLTLISPLSMFAGHLASILGLFLLYTIATMPIVCAVYLLAGIDWHAVPAMYAVIAVSALTCAAAGMLCSAFARSTLRAVVGAYILSAFMLGGYIAVIWIALEFIAEIRGFRAGPWTSTVEGLLLCTPPALVLRPPFVTLPPSSYVIGIGSQLVGILIGLAVAWTGFRRLQRERVAGPPTIPAGRSGGWKTTGPEGTPFTDSYNVVFQREWRVLTQWWRWSKRLRWAILVGWGLVFLTGAASAITLLALEPDAWVRNDTLVTWILSGFGVIFLIAPGASTPLWIRERDMGTREQLIMTLLGPRDIIYGKAGAALIFTMIVASLWLLATSPALLLIGGGARGWMTVLGGAFALPLAALTLVSIGSQTPLLRVKSPMAVVLSYVFGIGYVLLPVFFSQVPDMLMMSPQQNTNWTGIILAPSPYGCWMATTTFDVGNGPLVLQLPIPIFAYYAGAFVVQILAVYAFLKDSIRVEGSKIRRGDEL